MLPGLDGLSLLQMAAAEGFHPAVLVNTYYFSEYITDALVRMNVDYAMQKPCNLDAVIARIRDLSGQLRVSLFTSPDPRTQISNILISLGIPTKLHGYSYLREAVLVMIRDMSQPITKELYPAVAKICNVNNPKLVERSIRSCIGTAWQRRDEQIWRLYFPPDESGQIPKPTNGDFISRLADYLLLQADSQFEE
jgi:two-component system response regulator (stage 0 sporulation protein A)